MEFGLPPPHSNFILGVLRNNSPSAVDALIGVA